MRRPILAIVALLLCTPLSIRAGGPLLVAGSGFDDDVKGQPLTWANGNVQYFTDQGDLSPILNNSQADAFVADAFASWASIPGVALSPAQAGHLAEDVSSANVVGYPDGSYTIPADIQPTAISTPVGIVYDYDGQVTEALLGYGAGRLDFCFTNAVYGGPDNFSTDGHLAHALVVINGVCAASSSQLPEVRYRLMRMVGRVLGLGWSQANLNVITGNPAPGPDDLQGFPLMHFLDPVGCVPVSTCYPGADIPKLDDRAALGRLYPANGGSQPQTARIHGSVFFTDAHGNPLQPMQGVNVVARRIDGAGPPSRSYVATSASGFAFRGNAGNTINGFVDASGQHYDLFGSDDPAVEGAFDLGGLELPDGAESAQFELSVEALDANWSQRVGPYSPFQVSPSGWFVPLIVTLQRGSDVAQDILMQQCQTAHNHFGSSGTYANPANLPGGGGWGAWISGYGDADWFQFTAQANRSASVAVTAVDENGQPTQAKLLPVIGIWPLSDQSGDPAPAATPVAFNTLNPGMTRLDAQFNSSKTYRLGIADFRGDGRPDYFYVASVLYSDSVAPSRLSLAGGVVSLQGIGFHPGLQVSAGGNDAPVLTASANHLEVLMPQGVLDGTASIVVTDPASGAFSQMTDALNYGASATDQLLLLQGAEPATAVGSPAANPIRLRAVAADGATPVSGATLRWTATLGAQLSACNGGSTCAVMTDEAGVVSTWVTPAATGQSTITAALAPASYIPPKSKQVTVLGTSSALDLAAVAPTKWIGQGATLDVPLTVRVLSQGAPQSGAQLNFHVTNGAATLSAASGTTNGSGYATITAHVANHAADVQVSACLAPSNTTCQTFTLFATPAALWTLEPVSGSVQSATAQNPFQPLILRVTDGSDAANPVMGVSVVFQTTLARVNPAQVVRNDGDTITGRAPMPVILGTSQTPVITNEDGLASILPSAAGYAPRDVFIAASAARATQQFHLEALTLMSGDSVPNRSRVRQSTASSGRNVSLPAAPGPQYVWFGAAQAVPEEDPPADAPTAGCSEADQKHTSTDAATPDPQGDSSPRNSNARCGSVSSKDKEDQGISAETGLKKLNIDVDKSANGGRRR